MVVSHLHMTRTPEWQWHGRPWREQDTGPSVLPPSSTRCGHCTQASPTSCIHPPGGKHSFIWRRCSTLRVSFALVLAFISAKKKRRGKRGGGRKKKKKKKVRSASYLMESGRESKMGLPRSHQSCPVTQLEPIASYTKDMRGLRASQLRASSTATGSSLRKPNTNSSSSFKSAFKPGHLPKHSSSLPIEHTSSEKLDSSRPPGCHHFVVPQGSSQIPKAEQTRTPRTGYLGRAPCGKSSAAAWPRLVVNATTRKQQERSTRGRGGHTSSYKRRFHGKQ